MRLNSAGSKGSRIYEGDSQHGELEEYRASDSKHFGSVNHKTEHQMKSSLKG
ncbi:colicin E3/pyocin S6 family cytotoxin [Rahnella aquatilis]|uniref:colicin E3/pyocin S6 family cytotoxin n=1 Tax=Rahnella aquatilis TaxID=34038 RepID=UPI00365F1C32